MTIFLWIIWNLMWFCAGYFTWRSWRMRKETEAMTNAIIQNHMIRVKTVINELEESE